jgi:outer membrane protein assembly factor BamB
MKPQRFPIRHVGRALVLLALFALAAPACGVVTTSPGATPSPTPKPFHALFAAGTTLAALDPTSGDRIWSQALPGYTTWRPAATGEVVAIGLGLSTTQPPTGKVAAYAAKSGIPLWQQGLGVNTQGAIFTAGSQFVLATNAVSLDAPNAPAGLSVAALSPSDGSAIWRHTLTDNDLLAPILFSQDTVFVLSGRFSLAGMSQTLTALDAATGAQRWQKALGTGTATGSVAGDGAVYVSWYAGHLPAERTPHSILARAAASGVATARQTELSLDGSTLTAYRATDGTQMWQASGFMSAQAEGGGTLYATVAQQQPSGTTGFVVRAYRANSGEQLWQSAALGTGDIYEDKPVVCADSQVAYAFNMPEGQPSVHALSGANGQALWGVPLAGHVASSAAGLGRVYAGAVTSPPAVAQVQVKVVALDPTSGATSWTVPLDGAQGVSLALL